MLVIYAFRIFSLQYFVFVESGSPSVVFINGAFVESGTPEVVFLNSVFVKSGTPEVVFINGISNVGIKITVKKKLA
jgi:hypothetical protein